MRHVFALVSLVLIPLTATAKDNENVRLASNTRIEKEPTILLKQNHSVDAPKVTPPPQSALLAQGILAIRGHMRHLKRSQAKATQIAAAALEVQSEQGNKWLPVHLLLGLAANESDYRWWLKRGLDCGICQNRVNLFCRSQRCMKKLCRRLAKSPLLSFRYAMKELNNYRRRYCGDHKDGTPEQIRCVFNTYYQGPGWLRGNRRTCRFRRPAWMTDRDYRNRTGRCIVRNRYWLRAYCFARGVNLRKKSRWSCRKARSLRWINRAYEIDKTQR